MIIPFQYLFFDQYGKIMYVQIQLTTSSKVEMFGAYFRLDY